MPGAGWGRTKHCPPAAAESRLKLLQTIPMPMLTKLETGEAEGEIEINLEMNFRLLVTAGSVIILIRWRIN